MKSPDALYELGTISDHAWGTAVDIEPTANPFFWSDEWAAIERVAGVSEARNPDAWKDLWHKEPGRLWQKIKDINDAFVARLPAFVSAEEFSLRSRASKHHLVDARPPPTATD